MNYLDIIEDLNDQLRVFGYGFIIWSALFAALYDRIRLPNLSSKKKMDILNRLISIIHGQLTLWCSLYLILCHQIGFKEKNTYSINLLVLTSASYVAYDMLVCVLFDLYDVWLVFHHMITLLAFVQSLINKSGGYFIMYGIVVTEISNLPMHLRYIIGQFGYRQTKFYELIELIYFILFIVFRGCVGPYLLAKVWKDIYCPFLIKLAASGLMVYSIYYIYEMTKIIRRKLKQNRERGKRKIFMFWFKINQELLKLNQKEIIDPIL